MSLFKENKLLNDREIEQGKTVLDSKFIGLGVALTSRCPLKCIMCSAWEELWDIPEYIIEELKASLPYLSRLYWQGGEVFLSKHFETLFDQASQYPDLFQELVTSGILIDKQWANKLASSRLNLICSVDSTNKNIYEYIRKGASFEKLLECLGYLRTAKTDSAVVHSEMRTSINFTVMRSNYKDLEGLADFAEKFCFDDITVTPIDYIRGPENIFYHNDIEAFDYIKPLIKDLENQTREKGMRFHNWLPINMQDDNGNEIDTAPETPQKPVLESPACLWPWQHLFVDMGGDVKPHCLCPEKVGNVSQESLSEIWNNNKMQEYRRRMVAGKLKGFCNSSCISNIGQRELFRIR